jgi:hypothetical protein
MKDRILPDGFGWLRVRRKADTPSASTLFYDFRYRYE